MQTIWNKYKMIKKINKNLNINTYLAGIEPIIKEIIINNKNEYYIIKERLEKIKNIIKIYDIIEEKDKIYLVIDNDEEILLKIDKMILSEKLDIKKEGIIKSHGSPISKNEIENLFEMEKSMCKIISENYKGEEIKGSGFFCEIEVDNYPIKYALFTNNHIIKNISIGNIINIEYLDDYIYKEKKIKIDEKRRVYTNEDLDYTCIELYESDGFKDFFKIDPKIINGNNYIINNNIFILQYPKGKEISFSYGKIMSIKDDKIIHNASTEEGSSGSPIIRRCKNNYIIGIHYGGISKEKNIFSYNLGTIFSYILNDINKNEIICIYTKKDNKSEEIQLLHDYSEDSSMWCEDDRKVYLEAKEKNNKLFEENIELYINRNKTKFVYKYKLNETNEIKVKFIFKKIMNNMSFMFYNCSSLNSIDLSKFNTNKVTSMRSIFYNCSSLKSIDLSKFNKNNITDISYMFYNCSSLNSIDLSKFNTDIVIKMNCMFCRCSSLNSIDLSKFNTNNVIDMSFMFSLCSSLKLIDLSKFNTNNVTDMSYMFCNCSSLKSIDLSNFNTNNVTDMSYMFYNCSSLKSIDLSNFNTNNVADMSYMFSCCSSLKSLDLSKFNTNNNTDISDILSFCSSLKKQDIKINNKNDKLLNEI